MSSQRINPYDPLPLRMHQCFLCDLPKMPWALTTEFSEIICRGCVKWELTERIIFLINQTRAMKRAFAERPCDSQCRNSPINLSSERSAMRSYTRIEGEQQEVANNNGQNLRVIRPLRLRVVRQ